MCMMYLIHNILTNMLATIAAVFRVMLLLHVYQIQMWLAVSLSLHINYKFIIISDKIPTNTPHRLHVTYTSH